MLQVLGIPTHGYTTIKGAQHSIRAPAPYIDQSQLPPILTHGTYAKVENSIRQNGIRGAQSGSRAVNLLDPQDTRHKGAWRHDMEIFVDINPAVAYSMGCMFRRAANGVWEYDNDLPPECILGIRKINVELTDYPQLQEYAFDQGTSLGNLASAPSSTTFDPSRQGRENYVSEQYWNQEHQPPTIGSGNRNSEDSRRLNVFGPPSQPSLPKPGTITRPQPTSDPNPAPVDLDKMMSHAYSLRPGTRPDLWPMGYQIVRLNNGILKAPKPVLGNCTNK